MSFEKIEHQNESLFHKRISQLLYPLIFFLFFTLNGYGQPKDSKITSDQKSVNQIETLQDSSFIKIFKNILNKLIKPEFSDLEKDRLINDFIMGLDFYFNESNDTLYTIKRENMYIKRRGLIEPLE